MTCCNVLYIPPGIILSKKCSTAQSFICKAVTSYKIHTLVTYLEVEGLFFHSTAVLSNNKKKSSRVKKSTFSRAFACLRKNA